MDLLTGDGKRPPDSEQRPPFHQTEGATPTTTPQIHPAALSSENPESIAPPHGLISVFPGFEITRHEADQSLEEYMTTMLPEFPFVPLPSSNLSQALEEKPLLTKTIICVCRPPPFNSSAAFESWFRRQIAHEAVVLTGKNLELVQAILVFLAW